MDLQGPRGKALFRFAPACGQSFIHLFDHLLRQHDRTSLIGCLAKLDETAVFWRSPGCRGHCCTMQFVLMGTSLDIINLIMTTLELARPLPPSAFGLLRATLKGIMPFSIHHRHRTPRPPPSPSSRAWHSQDSQEFARDSNCQFILFKMCSKSVCGQLEPVFVTLVCMQLVHPVTNNCRVKERIFCN